MQRRVTVSLQVATSDGNVPDGQLIGEWVNAACASADWGSPGECYVTVRIVEEDESQQLNETFRQKNSPTNVLAFPGTVDDGFVEADIAAELGDIVICFPLVRCEASEQGKTVTAHLAHLVVHGVLHLLGYRHDDDEDAMTMEQLETRILEGLGFPDPYRDGPDAGLTLTGNRHE